MLRLILGSAVVGVVIALGMSAVLRLIHFGMDNAIIGAVAGIGAGLFAANLRKTRD